MVVLTEVALTWLDLCLSGETEERLAAAGCSGCSEGWLGMSCLSPEALSL